MTFPTQTLNLFNLSVPGNLTLRSNTMNLTGALNIPTGGILTLATSLYDLGGSTLTLSGTINRTSPTAGLNIIDNAILGTGGTLNTPVRFGPFTQNVTIPNRSYTAVTIQSFGNGVSRSVILSAGVYTFPTLTLGYGRDSHLVTLDASVNNPSLTIQNLVYADVGNGTPGSVAVNAGAGSWTFSNSTTLSTGTFNANSSSITFQSSLNVSTSAVFNAGTSTVTFAPASGSTSTLAGSVTFYALQDITPNTGLQFESGSTTTVTNLILAGASGNDIVIRSSSTGVFAYLIDMESNTVNFVDVKDNNASGGLTIRAGALSTNSGNMVNWTFGEPAPASPQLVASL